MRQPIAGERGGWLRGVPAETAGSKGPDAAGPAPPRRSPPLIIAGEARTPRTPLGTLSRGILSWARTSQALRGVPGREGSSPPLPQTSCTTTNLTPVASGALICPAMPCRARLQDGCWLDPSRHPEKACRKGNPRAGIGRGGGAEGPEGLEVSHGTPGAKDYALYPQSVFPLFLCLWVCRLW